MGCRIGPVESVVSRVVTWDAPFDLHRSLRFMRRGPGDPTHQHVGDAIWRTTRMPTGPTSMRLQQTAPGELTTEAWGDGAAELIDRIDAWFPDPGFSPPPDAHAVVVDAHRRFPGLRVPATGRVGEALLPAILEQKVLGVDAFASWRRLLHRFGDPAPGPTPPRMRIFPAADQWAAIPSWDWHLAGVDPQRYRTAQVAARSMDRLDALAADPAAVERALRSLPGIGAWTVAEVGVRALGDADAVSWGDYHLGSLVGTAFTGEKVELDRTPELLEPYRPHRGLVVQLLHHSPLVRVERRGPRMSRIDNTRR